MLKKCLINLTLAKLWAEDRMKGFLRDEEGEVNIIAIIIILAIAIALAIIFRNQIKELFDRIWGAINSSSDKALKNY